MTTTPGTATDIDAAAERVRALSEQVAEPAKENGLVWLEGYERLLKTILDFEEQAAKETGSDWVTTLATTHADFVRQTSEVFFGALRGRPKA